MSFAGRPSLPPRPYGPRPYGPRPFRGVGPPIGGLAAGAGAGALGGALGALGGTLGCLLCLAAIGALGLFACVVAITAYTKQLLNIYKRINGQNSAADMQIGLVVLCASLFFAFACRIMRS